MLKINKKIEYALLGLHYISLGGTKRITSTKEICEKYNLPFDPTARVLQIMTQKGILKAVQGIKGGYQIKKDISKISLKELSAMLIGPIEITNCQSQKKSCSRQKYCPVSSSFKKINKNLNTFFENILLSEFVKT